MDLVRPALASLVSLMASGCAYFSVGPLWAARVSGPSGGTGWGARSTLGLRMDDDLTLGRTGFQPTIGMEVVGYDWGHRGAMTLGATLAAELGSYFFAYARPALAIAISGAREGDVPTLAYGIGAQVDAGLLVPITRDPGAVAGLYFMVEGGCAVDTTTVDGADGGQCGVSVGVTIFE
ncbi:MAG: hypothetical protein IT385_27220 [Deltaproteobacteria bacterium]|nr:hypothetical protein [Deltaproteobacteria bacterium]